MMRTLLATLALLLAGCGLPSVDFQGIAPQGITREGFEFSLLRKGDEVEIIRHGHAWHHQTSRIRRLMADTIMTETGCLIRPDTFRGDARRSFASLACPARPAPDGARQGSPGQHRPARLLPQVPAWQPPEPEH